MKFPNEDETSGVQDFCRPILRGRSEMKKPTKDELMKILVTSSEKGRDWKTATADAILSLFSEETEPGWVKELNETWRVTDEIEGRDYYDAPLFIAVKDFIRSKLSEFADDCDTNCVKMGWHIYGESDASRLVRAKKRWGIRVFNIAYMVKIGRRR